MERFITTIPRPPLVDLLPPSPPPSFQPGLHFGLPLHGPPPSENSSKKKIWSHSPSLPSMAESFSAHATTALWWPEYTRIASPDAKSHSLAVPSEEAVTR
jgi:hypothetical protein